MKKFRAFDDKNQITVELWARSMKEALFLNPQLKDFEEVYE